MRYKYREEIENTLYENALLDGSFRSLVARPYLLFRWGQHHNNDWKRIATIASHRRGNHKFCDDDEKCYKVEKFMRKQLITRLAQQIQRYRDTKPQLDLL